MPRMLHRSAPSGVGQKVFIATPTYGDLSSGYTYALFHTGQLLLANGIQSELAIYSGDCHVDDARNRLVRDFLETDCTDLLFVDADLRWQPENVAKILSYDRDVVAATYPLKQDEEKFPVRLVAGENWADGDGLLEAEAVPTGFLRIKRHVLQQLYDESVKFKPKSDNRSDLGVIFERTVIDGQRWGGDYTFCRKWRQHGQIFVDPTMWFDHHGDQIYSGRLCGWLKRKTGMVLPGLQDIRQGTDSEEVYQELFNEWGNQWAASPALLCALADLSRSIKGDILEAGSGLSSLVMAAANPNVTVIALESNEEWMNKVLKIAHSHKIDNLVVLCAPIVDGWYDLDPKGDYSMVVCDGPCREDSNRSKIYEYVGNAIFVMDDAEDKNQARRANEFAEAVGRKAHVLGKQRPFIVIEGDISGIQAEAV